jgi:hypothetical protein
MLKRTKSFMFVDFTEILHLFLAGIAWNVQDWADSLCEPYVYRIHDEHGVSVHRSALVYGLVWESQWINKNYLHLSPCM